MERKRVNSSKLRSVGYDEATKTLEVEMSNGQVYQYTGVYPEVYRRFMAAPNPTRFFDDKIDEEYTARRVEFAPRWKPNASTRSPRRSPRCNPNRPSCGGIFDFEAKEKRLEALNRELEDPKLWNNPQRAQEIGKE